MNLLDFFQAFSHFTFERSGHELVVVDVQVNIKILLSLKSDVFSFERLSYKLSNMIS